MPTNDDGSGDQTSVTERSAQHDDGDAGSSTDAPVGDGRDDDGDDAGASVDVSVEDDGDSGAAGDGEDEGDVDDDGDDAGASVDVSVEDDGDSGAAGDGDDEDVGDGDDTTSGASDASDDLAAATPEQLKDEIARLRAETAALQQQLDDSTTDRSHPTKEGRRHGGRWWASTVCVVLGAILLPISVIGRWTSTTMLDTDTYVATVAPLADDEDVQEAVAFRVSEVIVDVIDIEALVRDDLPPGTRFLAGPIEAASRTLIDNVVEDFVSTDVFARFWADANRIGHEGVVAVLTGESTERIDAGDGRVVLNVGPLVQGVIEQLEAIIGVDLADSIPQERLDGQFVLVESEDLANLQDTIRLFDQLSVIIPILTLALFGASIYFSERRRIGWRNVGYATVIPMTLCLLLYTWARSRYTDGLPDTIHNPDAAAAFFDITTRLLTRDLWVVLVIGLVILFVSWLVGPTGWAGRALAWWRTLTGTAGADSADSEVGAAPRWVARNERILFWGVFVVGVATLLLWPLPTATVVVLTSAVTGILMFGIHTLAEIGRKAEAVEIEDDAAALIETDHADTSQHAGDTPDRREHAAARTAPSFTDQG